MSELSDLLREVSNLLIEARAMIRDMDHGWPTKELHRPPEDLCAAITAALDDDYDYEMGETP